VPKQIITFRRYPTEEDGGNGKNGLIYDIWLPAEVKSERERFFEKERVLASGDLDAMVSLLLRLPNETNFEERDCFSMNNFRYECGDRGYAMPHQYDRSELRLFCILWNANTLIICNGDIKSRNSRTWQEDSRLAPIGHLCERIENALLQEVNAGRLKDHELLPGFFKGKRNTLENEFQITI
jgi:hypothetical protein